MENNNLKQKIAQLEKENKIFKSASKQWETIQKLLQESNCKLKDTQEELITARKEAEAATKAKASFLASMSHEIRTPMNGIIGMTSLLTETALTSEQQEFVRTIRISGDSLLIIINDILDYSKIESGKMDLEKQPFELKPCIEDVFDLLNPKVMEKNIELLCLIEPDVPEYIVGDVTRLRQIIINLVCNALKFTDKGEIVVSAKKLSVKNEINVLRFSVADTGIGIPKDKLDRIFKSFSQVDASTTRKYGGTGLGLEICERLTNLMDGKIWVDSVEGKGSTFFFTIKAGTVKSAPKKYIINNIPHLENKRILIVDDNATNRRILTLQCQQWRMLPLAVSSGSEALKLIKQDENFDLGILNMQMPQMDGAELGREIRKLLPRHELPLIMLSSIGKPDLNRFGKNVFDAFLNKPVKQSKLFNSIITVLSQPCIKVKKQASRQICKIDSGFAERIPLRILVVEDNIINQMVARKMLSKLGYDVDVAANGEEALQSLERQPYDLIFMDCQMPVMDGYTATQLIRRSKRLKVNGQKIKIVAMTANVMEGDREKCMDAGMDDYISKPVNIMEIQTVLEHCSKSMEKQ